jgi:hypothetical protein
LRLLEPCRADGSVREELQRLERSDDNKFIRSQARTMLAQTNEIY